VDAFFVTLQETAEDYSPIVRRLKHPIPARLFRVMARQSIA
jgi:hypothetical protein